MTHPDVDKIFAGSIPQVYEEYLVPLIFEPYARDLVRRLTTRRLSSILEIAAGTGVVTRHLAAAFPETVSITATDLNRPMLEMAARIGTVRDVEWHPADAVQLPFDDARFDAVVCQFGVMFFPDRIRAFAEVHRVLRAGGIFIFNVWDRIEENEFAATVTTALATMFPDDPPRFMIRTPHGYHDVGRIREDLHLAGFASIPQIDTVAARSKAITATIAAHAFCQGTPLRSEIEARDQSRLQEATNLAASAIARRFGSNAVDAKMQALIVAIDR